MIDRGNESGSGTVVIGVGNEFRGDDVAGLIVARRIRELVGSHTSVVEQSGEGGALIESMRGVRRLLLIDATQSGAAAGAVRRFDACAEPLPVGLFHYSTHAFSVAEAVETARALGQLPPELIVYGIEGRNFGYGDAVSEEVRLAAERIAADLGSELSKVY
jgi:hydrogenase maturation protease